MKEKKQKKHNYKIIIGLLLGLAIGSIGVYSATQIASSNVTYTNNSQSTVSGALDNLFNKTKLKVGSYVSMTPYYNGYPVTGDMTGCVNGVYCGTNSNGSAQRINPSELNTWIIIHKNKDGTYDAVSEYVSSIDVYFNGQIGYQKFIKTLNTIADSYQNSTYTTKARHMGYSDQTEEITDTSKLTSTTAPWTYNTYSYQSSYESKGFGDVGYLKDYYLVKEAVGKTQANRVGTTTPTEYWLASRAYIYNSSTSWEFMLRFMRKDIIGTIYNHIYYYNNSLSRYDSGKAIRPIITLKSGIKVTGGSGTSADPYTISV